MLHSAIITAIESFAPTALQESWDNTGLQIGSLRDDCTGVLVAFDVTPDVVAKAEALGCNLIIAHHPLFFKDVKRLTGNTDVGAAAIMAVRAGITVYCSHTAADSAEGGVSYALARRIGVEPVRALVPKADRLVQLTAIVPRGHADEVRAALFDAGCGAIGNYDCCSFTVEGSGTFRAKDGAHPFVGEIGENHTEDEVQIAVVLPRELMSAAESTLREVHPYEEPAFAFTPMLNRLPRVGLGVYGISEAEMAPAEFIAHVKKSLGCRNVRTTPVPDDPDLRIRRVAVCGGAGGEFIGDAIAAGAQAYVSADIRYHDFVTYRDRILLIDAGHFETEAPVKQLFAEIIRERFPMVPVYVTDDPDDNPIRFF